MPITPTYINFPLVPATPTVLTPENLKIQLNALGFRCPLTNEASLQNYIQDGLTNVPNGGSYLVAILSSKSSVETRASALSKIAGSTVRSAQDIAFTDSVFQLKSFNGQVKEYYLERVNGSYALPGTANTQLNLGDKALWELSYIMVEKLSTIVQNDNFDKLRDENYDQFANHSGYDSITKTIQETDANTIRDLLAGLVVCLSSKVLYDLKKSDVLPVLVNRLGFIETTTETFNLPDDLITVWANKPDGKTVEALGAINCIWNISGKNDPGSTGKKNGRSPVHTTTVALKTRSVIYSDNSFIETDYKYITESK
jgi:hypothetical protein